MEFKQVTNIASNITRYYINNKRVSKEKFTNLDYLARIKRLNYNSSYTLENDIRRYNIHSYN